jgi:hypothetical protein
VIAENEAEVLQRIARRVMEGASMLAIARELDAAGVPTREVRPWHSSTVRSVLINPAVAGLRVHRREIAGPGEWEPIFDRATWEQLRAVVADPARKRARAARKYLLAGIVETTAGDRMNGSTEATGRHVYTTRGKVSRPMSIDAAKLEEFVTEAVLTATDRSVIQPPTPSSTTGTEVARLEAELADLAALRGAGTISLAEWLAARDPLQRRLEAVKRAAGTVRRMPTRTAQLVRQPGAIRKRWPSLDFAARREILTSVVERIVISQATRLRWTPIAERVDIRWRV